MSTALATINKKLVAKLGVPIWTRRDGSEVYIDAMDDWHLLNALAILKPWKRDCKARGEREMARCLDETIVMMKREQRRRAKNGKEKI